MKTGSLSLDLSLEKLLNAPYAVASWRLPNEKETHKVISLSTNHQGTDTIKNLPSGFIINKFHQSHPINPVFIPGDIILKGNEYKVDPKLSDSAIDVFQEQLAQAHIEDEPSPFIKNPATSEYEALVSSAIDQIRSGHFEKLVLARHKDVLLPTDFSASKFFELICCRMPSAFCSIVSLPGEGIWIGASPELLISQDQQTFKTISLAGTKKLNDQSLSNIAWTQKEIEEQAFVSRYIVNCFKKIRLREFSEHGPKTVKAGNLAHLKTEYEVNFQGMGFNDLGSQMLDLLHPTSAVCGMPMKESEDFISQYEGFDREYFAGFLGPINIYGATNLFVNLRCMKAQNGLARLYAGAGITEDSDPIKELNETELKMSVLGDLI